MKKFEEILMQTGLGRNESRAYVSLLGLGPATIASIAQAANIHRPIVYKIVPMLLSKGLILKVLKGKRNYYVAESPEKLKGLFDATKNQLSEIIPQLQSMQRIGEEKPVVKFISDVERVK